MATFLASATTHVFLTPPIPEVTRVVLVDTRTNWSHIQGPLRAVSKTPYRRGDMSTWSGMTGRWALCVFSNMPFVDRACDHILGMHLEIRNSELFVIGKEIYTLPLSVTQIQGLDATDVN